MASVLIVDDHPGFRRFARRLLQAEGLDVVGEASDQASALEAAWRLRPEFVLLDVLLGDSDGFAVAERLRRQDASLIVVLTSSRDPADLGARLRTAAIAGFVHKDELSAAALTRLAARGWR